MLSSNKFRSKTILNIIQYYNEHREHATVGRHSRKSKQLQTFGIK